MDLGDKMKDRLRLALVQMRSTNRHAGNIETLRQRAAEAAAAGAEMLALPEAAGLINRDAEDARRQITLEADDPFLKAAREEAAKHGLWIQTGSTPMLAAPMQAVPVQAIPPQAAPMQASSGDQRFVNRGHLIDPDGRVTARYDKIHLFDVTLPGQPPRFESDRYAPGHEAIITATPWGPMGLTICYDVRFPHLFRQHAQHGARLIFVPSAFAMATGEAHWELLIRTRAIENGCFVIAAAQAGHHDDGRETWGHSLAVDPWGRVLADLGKTEGLAILDLDLSEVEKTRAAIPSLANERAYTYCDQSGTQAKADT